MVEDQKVEEFIELRSNGLTFARIEEQRGLVKTHSSRVSARLVLENGPISVSFGQIGP